MRPEYLALLIVGLLMGCSGDNTPNHKASHISRLQKYHGTSTSVMPGTPIALGEKRIAFLADEASTGPAGKDFNGDGDTIDSVGVVVNTSTKAVKNIGVAARGVVVLANETYWVVDEAEDSVDWNQDGAPDDLVLVLRRKTGKPQLVFVADLASEQLTVAGDRLFFREAHAAPLVAPETSLSWVSSASGGVATSVINSDPFTTLDPLPLAEVEDLLFLGLDETVEGRDLNGDGDATDAAVLGLLDATDPGALLLNVGLAVSGPDLARGAALRGPGDWLVTFLVDEASQGGVNLNAPALFQPGWQPPQCVGSEDTDAADAVLHFLHFAAWASDPIASPPVNTGLVGYRRVLATRGSPEYVGTLSPEADEGGCFLNSDGDAADLVPRWVEANPAAILPYVAASGLVAIEPVPGGAEGMSVLDDRWLVAISEASDGRDYDGDPLVDRVLVAWLNPALGGSAAWVTDHTTQTQNNNSFRATDWMGAGGDDFVPMTWTAESMPKPCGNKSKPPGAVFSGASFFDPPDDLDTKFFCYSAQAGNAGISIAGDFIFFRVDEAAEQFNWNQDGDRNDRCLVRFRVGSASHAVYVGTLNDLPGPAVVSDPDLRFVAYLVDESMASRDLNDDGDRNDFILRYSRRGAVNKPDDDDGDDFFFFF